MYSSFPSSRRSRYRLVPWHLDLRSVVCVASIVSFHIPNSRGRQGGGGLWSPIAYTLIYYSIEAAFIDIVHIRNNYNDKR